MASRACQRWVGERAQRLDEIEASHAAVGGSARGRRFTTLQINQSYAVMLTSQFQGFCRDLHDECVGYFVACLTPAVLQATIKRLLEQGRKLDVGNPNPGNLGSDFGRFGVDFWSAVQTRESQSGRAGWKSSQTGETRSHIRLSIRGNFMGSRR